MTTHATPILEIAIAPILGRTIDDELTADGEVWREIFSHVMNIPGLIRSSWSLNHHNRDINMFLVDWESYPQHERFMNEQGTLSKPIMDLMTGDFNMYHIQTTTQSRAWLRAPVTYLSFYVLPPSSLPNFAALLTALKDAYALSSGFVEVVSGDARNPPRHDPQGWMKNGQGVVIVLSGWESPEALGKALERKEVSDATKEVEKLCKTGEVSVHVYGC
ncbi:hypothetical protein NA57DRAFT_77087 [Rhizodiscina lignyota]|uniref:ABM domain-containing protein n=1 Tax=Rhizodiscina lignyota TaxID=1504668 RepID=A0A9P4IE14_9PEZI|nr:hypothetical protein NA57DRAFT_77087 [Rhizodiscina lignyota]